MDVINALLENDRLFVEPYVHSILRICRTQFLIIPRFFLNSSTNSFLPYSPYFSLLPYSYTPPSRPLRLTPLPRSCVHSPHPCFPDFSLNMVGHIHH
jgi:hypothetical protein